MNFLITGATGFIGKRLAQSLVGQGHHVFILTRTPAEHTNTELITFLSYDTDFNRLPPIAGIVNLAGESLFGYWSGKKKERIRRSRVETTKKLVENIRNMETKPQVFINGSAVGYYGTSKELAFSEKTTKPGNDFFKFCRRRMGTCCKGNRSPRYPHGLCTHRHGPRSKRRFFPADGITCEIIPRWKNRGWGTVDFMGAYRGCCRIVGVLFVK